MKKKFVYKDEKSHKFWNIEIKQVALTVEFGKYGTTGQIQTKLFNSEEDCLKAAEKLIAEKTKKGYTLVVEDLPPRELYNDIMAVARMLEAQFPDKVEITPVSEANIKEMEATVGFPMDEEFQAYWLEKGSFFFDKDDFICALYAFDQNGPNANNLYGFLSVYCYIHRCHFDALDEEKDFLSQCTIVLGLIIKGDEKWVLVNNPVGIYLIHYEKEFQHYSEEEFMHLLAPVLAAKEHANYTVTPQPVIEEEDEAEEDEEKEDTPADDDETALFKEMSYAEVLELLEVDQLFEDWDDDTVYGYDTEEDYFEDTGTIYVHEGDLHLDKNLSYGGALLVVVGNLTVAGVLDVPYYVTGNVTTEYLSLDSLQYTRGVETVQYLAVAWGEDDEALHKMRFRKINAPHFVSWFYDLECFEFGPDTVITALYNHDTLDYYKTKNTFLAWHNYALAFRSELCYVVEAEHYDSLGLSTQQLHKALKNNQPIWKDGVTEEGIRLVEQGMNIPGLDAQLERYHCYKQAIAAAPGYYLGYLKAGELLFDAKAYVQAGAYFKQGIPLSPDKLLYDYGCIGWAALCEVRTGNYEAAISIAKLAGDKDYFPLRVWGEALLLQGQPDEAREVLEKSVAIRSVFSNHWLLGLVYYLQGDKKKALKHYDIASYNNKKALPYEQAQSLHYFYGDNVTVDWDTTVPVQVVRDQAYWQDFFNTHPVSFDNLLQVPEEFRTTEMVSTLLQQKDVTGEVLKYLSPALYTQELILQAVDRESPLSYHDIPAAFLTDKVFELHAHGVNLEYLPDEKKTYELCFKQVAHNQYNYRYVPDAFKDERMNIALVAGGVLNDVHHKDMPRKYYTDEYILQAIDIDIDVINRIPPKLVSREVYEHAVARYGQDPKWPFIVDRYSRECWRYGSGSDVADMGKLILQYGYDIVNHLNSRQINKHSYAYYKKYLPELHVPEWEARKHVTNEYLAGKEFDYDTFGKVWACFWDENFIINVLKAGDRLFDVPARYITPKIVDAALAKNTWDFPFVPVHMLTQELCNRVFSKGDYDELDAVPLAMRTLELCSKAVAGDGKNLRYVPLELRGPELCAAAVAARTSARRYVPKQHYSATFEIVHKRFGKRMDPGFVSVNWGLGLVLDGKYEEAVKKLEQVTKDYQHEAVYYLGWSAYLRGDEKAAKELWKQSQDIAKEADMYEEDKLKLPYADFQLPEVPGVYEFSQLTFDKLMMEASLLVQDKQYDAAIEILQQVEEVLTAAQSDEMRLWAYVWDHQRYALYEAGQQDGSLAICRRMIEDLGKVTLWEYLEEHNIIRAALRAAHNSLAYRCYENGEIAEGLKHSKACMKIISSIEDKSVLNPFYETQALLMHKAGDEKGFEKVVAKIKKQKLEVGDDLAQLMS